MQTVECPGSPSGNHLWCPCFGTCKCNRTNCTMCDASRDMTPEEIADKQASVDVVSEDSQ